MSSTRVVLLLALALATGACGSQGPAGTPALDTGTISGSVKDASGAAVSGASITTNPASATAQSDANGNFTLGSVPIGSYQLTATKTGYQSAQQSSIGVAAGESTQVTLTLAASIATAGSISGVVYGRQGIDHSVPITGATVCVEGTGNLPCATTQSDGSFALPNVAPGPTFLAATAAGFLAGETRSAVSVTAGATTQNITVTLSGTPSSGATYVGAAKCVSCHQMFEPSLVSAWQQSAHGLTVDHTFNHLDTNGWPAEPTSCAAPATQDSGVAATDPVSGQSREVYLVRWSAACTGEPTFAMALDSNQNGVVDAADTVIPVQGTQGGVAADAGNCGQGGLIPAGNPCSANYLSSGPTAARGWWQQEYLVNIGPGSSKPAWVSWDTSGTPQDMLALPLAWNQRTKVWVSAPDYNPTQGGTYAKVCAGCHETGPSLTTDSSGNVTTYVAGSQNIACERCHGPGSAHAASGDAQLIINPAYATAQAQNEACGQCHSNSVSSTQPSGVFDFAWNNQATMGGGNFIPGVHKLSDFATLPTYGDPSVYWPGGIFTSLDHMTYIDVEASGHFTNPYEKVTCGDCHDSHGLTGAPYQMQRTDPLSGGQLIFQSNSAALRDDVLCLSCHAGRGDFASVQMQDTARYHIANGGSVQLNGTSWTPSASDQATSTTLIANAVNAHMLSAAGMPAEFDPLASVVAQPVGRCSSCHMAKTANTATFFSGPDANGKTANVIGDVSSHIFKVAWPQDSLGSFTGATSWDAVMPNACGSCHDQYRFGM